jgi:DNA-directed RNA polymerase subunit H (RpoH/RPB5)
MSEYNSNISEIYTARINLIKQLNNSSYDTSSHTGFTMNEVHHMEKNDDLNFHVSNPNGSTIFVKYFIKKTIKPNTLQQMTSELFNNSFNPQTSTIILVLKEEPNQTLIELVKQIYAEEHIFIVLYHIKRLLFNILEHSMINKHIILNELDVIEFKEKYFISSDSQIPTISRFDPCSIANFIRPGQICKITRSSVNSVQSEYYRLCLNL